MGRLGNPTQPCDGIKRSKSMIETIEGEARANAKTDLTTINDVEEGLRELKADTVKNIGMTCSALCPKFGRCILESFGADDPLLRKPHDQLNEDQKRELEAKEHFDLLRALSQQALGISLF